MGQVKRIEQGQAGKFNDDNKDPFKFRRNTYLTNGFIVSTVGDFCPTDFGEQSEVRLNTFFETMVFVAEEKPDDLGFYFPAKWSDLEMKPAKNAIEAETNHEDLVEKWMKHEAVKKGNSNA